MVKEFLNKEERELIRLHNRIFGTDYRTHPYDLKKPEDFAELLTVVTAEFLDMSYLVVEADNLCELFDELVEIYYPDMWEGLHLPGVNTGAIGRAEKRLRAAVDALDRLARRAERQCRRWWKRALVSAPDEVLRRVAGVIFRPTREELGALLLFEFASPELRHDDPEETARAFGEAMYGAWCAMRGCSPSGSAT